MNLTSGGVSFSTHMVPLKAELCPWYLFCIVCQSWYIKALWCVLLVRMAYLCCENKQQELVRKVSSHLLSKEITSSMSKNIV